MKKIIFLYFMFAVQKVSCQSLPEWGPWWQQSIDREYGSSSENIKQSARSSEKIQQKKIDELLQERIEEQNVQNERVNESIQQKYLNSRLQQRILDEFIEKNNEEEILRQKNINALLQQKRYERMHSP